MTWALAETRPWG